ncbi:MAG: hypothetical protein HQM11_16045 [SAR324 cluster bacterium]|nr:hypothetical protein [SAR324 cluster bacterium]
MLDTESIGALLDPRFHGDDIVADHRISSPNYLQQEFFDEETMMAPKFFVTGLQLSAELALSPLHASESLIDRVAFC